MRFTLVLRSETHEHMTRDSALPDAWQLRTHIALTELDTVSGFGRADLVYAHGQRFYYKDKHTMLYQECLSMLLCKLLHIQNGNCEV